MLVSQIVEAVSMSLTPEKSRDGAAPSPSLIRQALLSGQYAPQLNGTLIDERSGVGNAIVQPGRCYHFDGANDYVTCGNIDNLQSVSFWIKPTSLATTYGILDYNGTSYLRLVSGVLTHTGPASATIYVDGAVGSTLATTDWHHVVVVYSTTIAASAMTAGRSVSTYGNIYLWDLRIFNSTLSATEVSQLYNLKTNALPSKPTVVHLKCEDQNSVTSYDASGNNHHGTKTNINTAIGQFHYEGADVPASWQNDKGYTISNGTNDYLNNNGTGLITVGTKIPRLESDKTKSIAYDVAGNRKALQYVGPAKRNARLVGNSCLQFDGTDDYVSLPSAVPITGTNYTYASLIKMTTTNKMIAGLSGDSNCYTLYINGTTWYHKPNSSTGSYATTTMPTTVLNGWHLCIVRRNGNGNAVDFFVDGTKVSATYAGTIPNNPCTIDKIGQSVTGFQYAGQLAFFTAWNRSLTDSECQSITRNNLGPTDYVYCGIASSGSGATLYDIAPGARHGTLTNGPTWATQDVFAPNAARGFRLNGSARIPARNTTVDATGTTLTHIPGLWLPECESNIDETGGVAFPGSSGLLTNYDPTTDPTNPRFRRKRTVSSVHCHNDRIVRYAESLSGPRLAGAERYTESEEI